MSFNARVSKTIKRVQHARKNGALISQSGTLKRLVFFEEGQLVGCRSSLPKERLGNLMVREGRITQEQLACAAEEIRTGRKMGQIFVALGYLKGGEVEGFVRRQILEVAGPGTKIIPGHGPLSDKKQLIDYRNMLTSIRDRVRTAIDNGKTLEQIIANQPTAAFDAKWGGGFLKPPVFVKIVHSGMVR